MCTGIYYIQPEPDTVFCIFFYLVFHMPAFIFPFFFVRHNLCAFFFFFWSACRTHSAQSSYFDRKQMFRKKSFSCAMCIRCRVGCDVFVAFFFFFASLLLFSCIVFRLFGNGFGARLYGIVMSCTCTCV